MGFRKIPDALTSSHVVIGHVVKLTGLQVVVQLREDLQRIPSEEIVAVLESAHPDSDCH